MKQISCPKCGSVFQVDEADYASIVSQVRNAEFEKDIEMRLDDMKKRMQAEKTAEKLNEERKFNEKLTEKDKELGKKDNEIARLNNLIDNMAQAKALELKAEIAKKDQEITVLKAAIGRNDNDRKMAVMEEQRKASEAIRAKDEKISELSGKISLEKNEALLREASLKNEYEFKLKQKQDEVDYYKDLKTKMSTKMIGESLEIHCSTEFNRARPMFPNAYFEKDNDASGGSKGDFIFRDFDNGTEYVSIMFEMKNEMDRTATKHRNEDFLKKLDEDRRSRCSSYVLNFSCPL